MLTIRTLLNPRNVLRIWHGLLVQLGIERCAFHVSHPGVINLLIVEDVPLKGIQEVAGEVLLSETADSYALLLPQDSRSS